ncbi:MAG TPA: helicase, partial [Methyloceanibacter sp.]|nr:helicase [Methyloceanibacter sp.]
AWLQAELHGKLKPLMDLSEASDLSGLARGLAYQLTENLGVLRRDAASEQIKALDQAARAQLRTYGIRFGAFNIYIPALLKPAAADLLLLLWSLHSGRDHGLDAEALPARPQHGLTSVEAGTHIPEPYWRAAGFHVAGSRAVRIDMLERLSDLIRARIAFRMVEGSAMAPTGSTGDGGFRVVPELMSVVGCSGEEFASILKALGFRRERCRLASAPAPQSEAAATGAAEAGQEPANQVPQEEAFDEVWRPGKRKEARHDTRASHKPRREGQARAPRRERQRPAPQAHHAERERKNAAEHSPFAALEALRRSLATRQPEGS